jgi:hypothetical protein
MEEKVTNSGFAFHAKVIFLFIAFAIYVGLELSLNLLLIDLYAQPVEKVFVEHAESVVRLDLFGRTVSSFGLVLAIIAFFPLSKFVSLLSKLGFKFKKNKANNNKSKDNELTPEQKIATWFTRPLVFVLIWLALIPSLRAGVDGWVHNRSNDQKLSAVRSVIYKEGYLSGTIKIEDFDQFNAIVEDKERRDLVVAIIPSLAYWSTNFNQMIERNLENFADMLLSGHQEQQFAQSGLPKLREFDRLYRDEYKDYQQTNRQYQVAVKRLNDRGAILTEQQKLIESVNNGLQSHWDRYVELFSNTRSKFKALSKNQSLKTAHHKYKDRFRAKSCNSACRKQVEVDHANYFNNIKYDNGQGLGIKVLPEHIFFSVLGTEKRILGMLSSGRKHWLKLVYGVGEHEEFEEFVVSEEARKLLIKKFKEKNVVLPSNWQTQDVNAIEKVLHDKYERQASTVWVDYRKKSQFDITEVGLDRIGFARHPTIKKVARRTLGQYYIQDFSPGLSERKYKKLWLAQQNNISFIRMVTSTAAGAAFAPGGSLYSIGNDAMKLAVILPFSVVLSFCAIFTLFLKFGIYLYKRNFIYLTLLATLGSFVFLLPIYQSISKENTYGDMMSSFASDFNRNDQLESLKTTAFGYILDVENGIFENYRDLPFIRLVGSQIFNQHTVYPAKDELVIRKPSDAIFDGINSYDDFMNEHFASLSNSFFPSFMGVGEIKYFDVNITVLKRDHSIGAFLGVNLDNEKVSKVTMPSFLENKDLAFLAEQRYFYNPELIDIANSFIDSYEDGDYLLALANGTVLRESATNKVEKLMVKLLNGQNKLLSSINNLQSSGYKNLVLVQMNSSENYRCFTAPTITSTSFAQAVMANNFNFQPIDNCRGVL